MGSERRILKKGMVMYLRGEFVGKMNVEKEEILRERKFEHTLRKP